MTLRPMLSLGGTVNSCVGRARAPIPARTGIVDYKPRAATAKLYCSGRT